MSASSYSIEVCPTSKVTVFQGSLKKAPNLNRRGRKKWKERFFILRANKMLECYKSRKAAAPGKSPRKVIDLRSCITLEVGLEYRELQHILSLGTFKKTFFFAAHSDALMLQWGDNIEKVKNALDGEIIEILDISLRRSPHRTPRHTTPPDDSSKGLYQYGTSYSSSAIAQLSTPMHEPISDRSPSLPPQPPPFSPTAIDSPSMEFDRDDVLIKQRQRSKSHDGTRRTRVYVNVSPRPPSSSPKHFSSSLTRRTRASDDTHQLATQRSKRGGMVEGGDYESSSLPRPPGKIPPPRIASRMRKDSTSSEDNSPISSLMSHEGVESIQASSKPRGASLKNGMTRSFRYRKIALRKEKPTVRPIPEYDSSDDEDEETESEYDSGPLSSKRNLAKSSPNLTSAGRRAGRHVRNGNRPAPLPPYHQDTSYQPTSYSKVTVVGVKVSTVSGLHVKRFCGKDDDSDHDGSYSRKSDTFPLPPPSPNDAVFAEFEKADFSSKHSSDTTLLQETCSINSLDKILEPPTMFEDPGDQLHPLPAVDNRDQSKIQGANEEGNRSSTESFDTGYNSSPGYTNKPTATKDISSWEGQKNERLCAPMVFFCPKVGRTRGVIGLQVCLVEQNADLMQKVVLKKEVEGYSVVECEQESGRTPAVSRPADGDTLTVETSLEDIEFGFSVVNTVQKDTFERRVREFQFELRDLFNSSSKPFSCEVHIRHADEVTVLPIEVERA